MKVLGIGWVGVATDRIEVATVASGIGARIDASQQSVERVQQAVLAKAFRGELGAAHDPAGAA